MDLIQEALARGQSALNEYDSKRFVSSFGIAVTREALATDPDSAVLEAVRIGFPVVLKVSGTKVPHKTEVEGVVLDLRSEEEVKEEGRRLLKIEGCEALLIQEMVKGDREFVCGLLRDNQFGPCIMFGVGGILTEVINDVAFRIAPLTFLDAQEMIQEIQCKNMMESFRGQSPVNIEVLCHILMAIGEIGLRYKDVFEIDINPLKIRPDGQPVAVDALVVLRGGETITSRELMKAEDDLSSYSAKMRDLTPFFEPSSVAIIGASSTPGKPGHTVIRNILANDYGGRLYLVNPKGGELLGLPVYSSITSLPDGIDLAIIILPAKETPQALQECVEKGIGHVVLSAGGFAEVDEYGGQIQQELIDIIQKRKVRVLGPNTSGHTSTPHRFTSTFFPLGRIRRGKVSYIAQTGNFATHTMKYILSAEHFGVSRVIGLGNKIDIDESDALEYLADDPETGAIIMYLESVKRPRRFLEMARKVTHLKPVVMLKGGVTGAGKHAAVAHTAAMAEEDCLVDGMLRQAGIVRIWDYTHLILAGKALSMLPLPKGNRISFLAPSGAMLVVLSDLCVRLGLEVPELELETVQRLQEISPPFIRMRNPVDIWAAASTKGVEFGYREGMEAVLKDPNVDAVVSILMLTEETGIPSFDFLIDLREKYLEKPILITFSGEKQHMEACKNFVEPLGIPTFSEIEEPFEVLSILARCRKAMNRFTVSQ